MALGIRALVVAAILVATAWQSGAAPASAGSPPTVPSALALAQAGAAGLAGLDGIRVGRGSSSRLLAPTASRARGLVEAPPGGGDRARRGARQWPGAAAHAPERPAIDTDGDGLSDLDEAAYGSDPLNEDFDADGLIDGVEVHVHGTDPRTDDTDGDGLPDGDEARGHGAYPPGSDAARHAWDDAGEPAAGGAVARRRNTAGADASGARLLPHGGADP